jgi:hypothetical protein
MGSNASGASPVGAASGVWRATGCASRYSATTSSACAVSSARTQPPPTHTSAHDARDRRRADRTARGGCDARVCGEWHARRRSVVDAPFARSNRGPCTLPLPMRYSLVVPAPLDGDRSRLAVTTLRAARCSVFLSAASSTCRARPGAMRASSSMASHQSGELGSSKQLTLWWGVPCCVLLLSTPNAAPVVVLGACSQRTPRGATG